MSPISWDRIYGVPTVEGWALPLTVIDNRQARSSFVRDKACPYIFRKEYFVQISFVLLRFKNINTPRHEFEKESCITESKIFWKLELIRCDVIITINNMIIHNEDDLSIVIHFDFVATTLQLLAITRDTLHRNNPHLVAHVRFLHADCYEYHYANRTWNKSEVSRAIWRRHASSTAFATFAAICCGTNHEAVDYSDHLFSLIKR